MRALVLGLVAADVRDVSLDEPKHACEKHGADKQLDHLERECELQFDRELIDWHSCHLLCKHNISRRQSSQLKDHQQDESEVGSRVVPSDARAEPGAVVVEILDAPLTRAAMLGAQVKLVHLLAVDARVEIMQFLRVLQFLVNFQIYRVLGLFAGRLL